MGQIEYDYDVIRISNSNAQSLHGIAIYFKKTVALGFFESRNFKGNTNWEHVCFLTIFVIKF